MKNIGRAPMGLPGRYDFLDRVVDFFVALGITILVGPLSAEPVFPRFSLGWFTYHVVLLFVTTTLASLVHRKLFLPPEHEPTVPRTVTTFDSAIKDASYNFAAISSKHLALWKSSTFAYYLTLNAVKNIVEYNLFNRDVRFSNNQKDREAFFQEGAELVRTLGAGEIPKDFFAVRLLVYPARVYRWQKEEILALIQMHSIARVHCIPIVRDKLVLTLTPAERKKLDYFAQQQLGQRIRHEYTDLSRLDRFILRLSRNRSSNPYSVSMPDFLMTNHGEPSGERRQVWWFQGNEPISSRDQTCANGAAGILRLICSRIGGETMWEQYSSETLGTVATGKAAREPIDFFSGGYFERWISEVVPKHRSLKRWISVEEQLLVELVRKNKAFALALDAGCGWGRHMEILLEAGVGMVYGVDKNPTMIGKCAALKKRFGDRVRFDLDDLASLPYEDRKFDLVVCLTNTFGNLGADNNKKKVAKELWRVLRPGGTLVLSFYRNTPQALVDRMHSYREVGLNPFAPTDGRTIVTKEGLVSEQFDPEMLEESYLAGLFEVTQSKPVDDRGHILVAHKIGGEAMAESHVSAIVVSPQATPVAR